MAMDGNGLAQMMFDKQDAAGNYDGLDSDQRTAALDALKLTASAIVEYLQANAEVTAVTTTVTTTVAPGIPVQVVPASGTGATAGPGAGNGTGAQSGTGKLI